MRMVPWILGGLVSLAVAAYFVAPIFKSKLDAAEQQRLLSVVEPAMPASLSRMMVPLPGGAVHARYIDPGEGNAGIIVLVHGFSNPSYVFRDYFEPLSAAGYLVVAPDLYGRGFSDRLSGPYDSNAFVEQIKGVVDHFGVDRPVHLIGYSMGAAVVARFAAKCPDKVETVGFIAPAGLSCGVPLRIWTTIPVVGDWLFRVLGPWLIESNALPEWKQAPDSDYWQDRFRDMAKYNGYEDALLSTLRHFPFMDSCGAMKAVKASGKRVLAIFADDDAIIPVAHASVLQKFPGNARIVQIPKRGHGVTYADPKPIIDEILKLVIQEP